jgi:hypothetical protein
VSRVSPDGILPKQPIVRPVARPGVVFNAERKQESETPKGQAMEARERLASLEDIKIARYKFRRNASLHPYKRNAVFTVRIQQGER